MAVKTFTTGEVLTAADTNTYLANAGLVHIKTATVTNAADSGTTWRSIFDGTYNAYRMVCHTVTSHTNGTALRMTFLYSTSSEQTTTYYSAAMQAKAAGTSTVVAVNNGAYIQLADQTDSLGFSSFAIDFMNVGASARSQITFQAADGYNGWFLSGGGLVATTRIYDGVKFFQSTGNISMTASIYGYRKA